MTIPYTVSGANQTNATQVSVLVTDKAYTESGAAVEKYGKLAAVNGTSLSGEGTFTLPSGLTGTLETDYHIYLLAEDVSEDERETDYANLIEITAANIDIVEPPAAKENLVYDGTEQGLVTAPEGSSYLYSLTGSSDDYKSAIPKGRNAGTYTVYYKENASAQAKSVRVTIAKKPATVTAKPQSVEVNGTIKNEAGEAVLSGAVEGHTLTAVTLTAGNVSAAGSSTVTPGNAIIKSGDTDVTGNYEITYAAGILTVTKKQPELKVDTIQPGGFTSSTAKLNGFISPAEYGTGGNVAAVGFRYRKAGASD